ncbi:hypothetical protein Scep_022910 [Stephania cephalantha]|uniref:HTH myb-type domain-containing protein n=1 Tax=Stephania cephalantha TaxID=152367 RepID=A0AAP0I2I4_9MAGN
MSAPLASLLHFGAKKVPSRSTHRSSSVGDDRRVSKNCVLGLRKGAWSEEEDILLKKCIAEYGGRKLAQKLNCRALDLCFYFEAYESEPCLRTRGSSPTQITSSWKRRQRGDLVKKDPSRRMKKAREGSSVTNDLKKTMLHMYGLGQHDPFTLLYTCTTSLTSSANYMAAHKGASGRATAAERGSALTAARVVNGFTSEGRRASVAPTGGRTTGGGGGEEVARPQWGDDEPAARMAVSGFELNADGWTAVRLRRGGRRSDGSGERSGIDAVVARQRRQRREAAWSNDAMARCRTDRFRRDTTTVDNEDSNSSPQGHKYSNPSSAGRSSAVRIVQGSAESEGRVVCPKIKVPLFMTDRPALGPLECLSKLSESAHRTSWIFPPPTPQDSTRPGYKYAFLRGCVPLSCCGSMVHTLEETRAAQGRSARSEEISTSLMGGLLDKLDDTATHGTGLDGLTYLYPRACVRVQGGEISTRSMGGLRIADGTKEVH